MRSVIILLFLVSKYCDGAKIVKRFANDEKADSFQVNVSAGYGVHFENTTLTTVSPVYHFQDRIQHENDSLVQQSNNFANITPPTYQVMENNAEVQDKKFEENRKPYRKRLVKPRGARPNYHPKNVHHYEQKENFNMQDSRMEFKQPPQDNRFAGTKVIEVLRVPAMYELRLQSDPERLVSLNSALLKKLMNQNVNQKMPQAQPSNLHYVQAAVPNNQKIMNQNVNQIMPQPQSSNLNYMQAPSPNNHRFSNWKSKSVNHAPSASTYAYQKVIHHPPPNGPNFGSSKFKSKSLDFSTQSPISYQSVTNEITDLHQKPQALHEVPAPVLNKPYNQVKPKPTVPGLVYGKPVDPFYQPKKPSWNSYKPVDQPPNIWNSYSKLKDEATTVAPIWNNNGKPIDQSTTSVPGWNSYGNSIDEPTTPQSTWNNYDKPSDDYPKTEPVWDSYNQAPDEQLHLEPTWNDRPIEVLAPEPVWNDKQVDNTYQPNYETTPEPIWNSQITEPKANHHSKYKINNIINNSNYQGFKNAQNFYNDAFGDYLDQTLVNTNGAVSTYLNDDGTMTVSNFHHTPKVYDAPEYENLENDEPSYNNQNEPQGNDIQTVGNQHFENLSANSRSYEFKRRPMRRMFRNVPKKPMNYILYIKERHFD